MLDPSHPDESLDGILGRLGECLERAQAPYTGLVVCGGAALIATGLHVRTTLDVDILALYDGADRLLDPEPLPEHLLLAAKTVGRELQLPAGWLNNGPSSNSGGLFQMGLPGGLMFRLIRRDYGNRLGVSFVGRLDQIHFKLYASVDRGGYHISDLEALRPTDEELILAGRWAMTHDVSPGFRGMLKQLLQELGHHGAAERL
ncbi:MAG: hypothetical protein KF886_16090 [Candidatus Hydrogenedentes bacterium]|nr:hypothetical protein [Candidatus Hydrogenedentota bacterium]